MKCFIICIGGTGQRVGRSMVHMLAADCMSENSAFKANKVTELRIMIAEQDDTCMDGVRYNETVNSYNDLANHGNTIFGYNLPITKYRQKPLLGNNISMGAEIQYDVMQKEAKDVYDFLYSDYEKGAILNQGFYGHTAIGSYYFYNSIVCKDNGEIIFMGNENDDESWMAFFNGINTTTDKVLIIGSIYGGTGASEIPTVAKAIRDVPRTSDVRLGIVIVQPYINPIANDNYTSDLGNKHIPQTRIALDYFRNQDFGRYASDIYVIGDYKEFMMMVEGAVGGEEQKNKANVIELYAASALVDLISTKRPEQDHNIKINWLNDNDNGDSRLVDNRYIDQVGSGGSFNISQKLASFFCFSIMVTKFFFHRINRKKEKKGVQGAVYFENFSYENVNETHLLEYVNAYCKSYSEWFRELHIDTDEHGVFNLTDPAFYKFNKNNSRIDWIDISAHNIYLLDESKLNDNDNDGKLLKDYFDKANPKFANINKFNISNKSARDIWVKMCNLSKYRKNGPGTTKDFFDELYKQIL